MAELENRELWEEEDTQKDKFLTFSLEMNFMVLKSNM